MIEKLILSLTPDERAALTSRCLKNESQLHKLINLLLYEPTLSQADLKNLCGFNSNTYFKNLNLAKEEIFDVMKMHLRNAYDDMLLANILYRRGLEVFASKLRIKLMDEYERQGWWSVLQEVYGMEMMVAYSRCDIKELEKIKTRILKNQERINRYTLLDKELIVQMAVIEKGDLTEKEFKAFEKKLSFLMAEAIELGHQIPVFNALHISYVFYTKYMLDTEKAGAVIKNTSEFLKKHSGSVIPVTRSVSWLNTANFLTVFTNHQSPDACFKEVEKVLGQHGLLFDAQAVLNFCYYYFLQKNIPQFEKELTRFKNLPTDKTFHYKVAFLHCLKAYLNKDEKEFNLQRNQFYNDTKSRDYNEYDLIVRYLEMLLMLRMPDRLLAAHKLEAAIKFARRNFTTQRIKLEKGHWQMFNAVIWGKPRGATSQPTYRLTAFMQHELTALAGSPNKR